MKLGKCVLKSAWLTLLGLLLPIEHCPCCYYRHTFAFANRINYALLSVAAGPF